MVFATDQQPYNWDNGPNGVLMNCYVSQGFIRSTSSSSSPPPTLANLAASRLFISQLLTLCQLGVLLSRPLARTFLPRWRAP